MPSSLNVTNWLYQLQNLNISDTDHSNADLVVVDYSHDGSDTYALTPNEVARMQSKADGSRRIVLSYLSIGEAEDYRYYWRNAWDANHDGQPDADAPSWLDQANPDWLGNYKVRYWDSKWQGLIYGSSNRYLDKIIDAGFDGAYLDIVDAYEYYKDQRPTAAQDMINFVSNLSEYAKSKKPDFLIFVQNAEGLLTHRDYLRVIDGIGKEDLFYGLQGDGVPNSTEDINYSRNLLNKAAEAGKLVLTIDYFKAGSSSVAQEKVIQGSYSQSQVAGFIPYVTGRDLDYLSYIGTSGNDLLVGRRGHDHLFGLAGNDHLRSGVGRDHLHGGRGKDTLQGNTYPDILNGGRGSDFLSGGAGNDTLTGGLGADQFIYQTDAAFKTASLGVDTITDFIIAQGDTIVLDKTTFPKISSVAGRGFSMKGEFAKVTTNALAAASSADIVYNTSTGELFYNQNGTAAGFGTGGKFLTLTHKPVLTARQFLIQS